MPDTASCTVSCSINATASEDRYVLADSTDSAALSEVVAMAFGQGAQQVTTLWHERITIGAASTTTLNLQALEDKFGNAISFDAIKVIGIRSLTKATEINLGLGGANAWTGLWDADVASNGLQIRGRMIQFAVSKEAIGWLVTAGSKNLLVQNVDADSAVELDLILLGN